MGGVAAGVVQLVQHGDDGAALPVEVGEEIEKLDLVGDVEEGRRLVEQQDRRFLRQHHGDPDALALAAGQFVHQPVGEIGDAHRRHRRPDRLLVRPRPLPQEGLVRIAPAADQIGDADAVGRRRALRQQAEPARDLAGGQRGNLPAVEHDAPGRRRQQPRQRPQQSRLATGVRPDDDGERPVGNGERQAGGDRARVVAQRHGIGVEAMRHARLLPSLRTPTGGHLINIAMRNAIRIVR